MKKTAFALLGISTSLMAAQQNCEPEGPAACNAETCTTCHCLGPAQVIANAPVCPLTCGGDFSLTVAGLYWQAHEDGLEYAVDNQVKNPNIANELIGQTAFDEMRRLNNLIEANYNTPNFKWDFGFRLGLSYCIPCDGWDVGIIWTSFKGHASSHDEAEIDDNHTLIPLWSAFAWVQGILNYATDIKTNWKLNLNLIDIELGRKFWVSHYLNLRPHVGVRVAYVYQNFVLEHQGGSYGARIATGTNPAQTPQNDRVNLDNNFKGVGLLTGLDSEWHLGCGWGIYGDFTTSIVYGRFSVDHDEEIRSATGDHRKLKILETEETFHASRAMLDLALGLQWMGMFCECRYGLTIKLGWEQHLFFHQNQLWRVVRNGALNIPPNQQLPNSSGENVYSQRRGTLDTQGWILTLKFDF